MAQLQELAIPAWELAQGPEACRTSEAPTPFHPLLDPGLVQPHAVVMTGDEVLLEVQQGRGVTPAAMGAEATGTAAGIVPETVAGTAAGIVTGTATGTVTENGTGTVTETAVALP